MAFGVRRPFTSVNQGSCTTTTDVLIPIVQEYSTIERPIQYLQHEADRIVVNVVGVRDDCAICDK